MTLERSYGWLRRPVDAATSPLVEARWYDDGEPNVDHACAVARDLVEEVGPVPAQEDIVRLARVLAQIPYVRIKHDASDGKRPKIYRVVDALTAAQYFKTHPEFPMADRDGGPSIYQGAATADARDCAVVWILVGPRGGESALHLNHPDHPNVACHIVGAKRTWYTRPGPNTFDPWHRI